MRIVQLVQRPQRRGAELDALELGARLRETGHTVTTVYLYPGDDPQAIDLDGVLLDGEPRAISERSLGFSPTLLRRLRGRVRDLEPDVLQVGGGRTVKYGALMRRIGGPGGPIVVWRNIGLTSDWVVGWRRRLFYQRVVMPRIHGVVGVSEQGLEAFRTTFAPTIPLQHIPTAVDPHRLRSQSSPDVVRHACDTAPGSPVLLFVGRLSEEKRPDRFLRVVQRARASVPGLVAWVVGDGPLRDRLQSQASAHGIEAAVRFLGARADVADIMGAADLLLMTSDTEGVPRVLVEAGMCGLAVASTAVGGVPELIHHGHTGWLIAPSDEDSLFREVVALLNDPELRSRLASAAATRVRADHTMAVAAARYVDFYARLLALDRNQPRPQPGQERAS